MKSEGVNLKSSQTFFNSLLGKECQEFDLRIGSGSK